MGTILKFFNPLSYNPGFEKFILAECQEFKYIFQIICISGYNSGSLSGYIKKDQNLQRINKKAISYSHLIIELKRNFGEVDLDTLKITMK